MKQFQSQPRKQLNAHSRAGRFIILNITAIGLLCLFLCSACVVKEELDDTYNQAHLGLNQWSLIEQEDRSYLLDFDVGYLIGLADSEGVSAINWSFELITPEQEILSYVQEEMRASSPEKDAIFVEGRRIRSVPIDTLLYAGETYVLWFTLRYREEILHEQLFALVAGEEGGNPNWIQEFIEETLEDPDQVSMLSDSTTGNVNEIGTETEISDAGLPSEAEEN